MTTFEIVFGFIMVLSTVIAVFLAIKNYQLYKKNTELAEMYLIPYLNIKTNIQWWRELIKFPDDDLKPSEKDRKSFGNKLIIENSGKGAARNIKCYYKLILKNGKAHPNELETIKGIKTIIGGADSRENSDKCNYNIILDNEREKETVDRICYFITYADNNDKKYCSCASFKLNYDEYTEPDWMIYRESKAYQYKKYKRRCDDCLFMSFNKRKIVEVLFSKMFKLKSLHFNIRLTKDIL